jgi:hypothetical protein
MSKLANVIIGIVLFSFIMLGTSRLMSDTDTNYNVTIEQDWELEFTQLSDNQSIIGHNMTEILESTSTNWVVSGLRMGYSVLKLTFRLPLIISGMFGNIADRLHLPDEMINTVYLIMTIIIIFVIVAALVRWYL